MTKDVLIIAHFCGDFDENSNNRFNYLTNYLSLEEEFEVELVTSNFSHFKKKKRRMPKEYKNYQITLLEEPTYTKNVSIKRFYSHHKLGISLKKYLKERRKPDIIYCANPSLDVAYIAAKYAERYSIRFILDVQDIWPEAFGMLLPVPYIANILFYPFKFIQEYPYKVADEIVAVSETYVKRGLKENEKDAVGHCIYLGTDLSKFNNHSYLIKEKDDEVLLVYIGTLGHSYDLKTVIDAVKISSENYNIKLLIIGDGPLKEEFEIYAHKKCINVEFTGRLPYAEMIKLLVACDIAVNPIHLKSAATIINKVCDYSAAGLPILNTQQSKEYKNLVEEYNIGFNCQSNNALSLSNKLSLLCGDKKLRKKLGENSRKLAEEKFDREKTYTTIKDLILNNMEDKNESFNTL